MKITSITIQKGDRQFTVPDYMTFIEARKSRWFSLNLHKYTQFILHLDRVHNDEAKLESRYRLPYGTLRGAHLALGNIQGMEESLKGEVFRHNLRNNFISFSIFIQSSSRLVHVHATEHNRPQYLFKVYLLDHNFFALN